MKKLLFMAMAATAISLASCGGRTATTAEPDSLSCENGKCVECKCENCACQQKCCEKECPKGAAENVVALLGEQIKSANPEQIKAIGTTIAETVSKFMANGDTEAVQKYTAIISNFVAENADKLKAIGASEIVSKALANVDGIPSDIVETATQAATGVKSAALTKAMEAIAAGGSVLDAVKNVAGNAAAEGADAAADASAAANAAKAAVEAAPEAAKAKAEEVKENVKQQATDAANKAIDDAAASAKKKLGL